MNLGLAATMRMAARGPSESGLRLTTLNKPCSLKQWPPSGRRAQFMAHCMDCRSSAPGPEICQATLNPNLVLSAMT